MPVIYQCNAKLNFLIAAFSLITFLIVPVSSAQSQQAPGFAVVELFTSEGCSSCPPADDLLAEIVESEKASGRAVYALAFHVDYWNYIGWTDPFSDASFSDRQRKYAGSFRSTSIYTPQMIVNGTKEFVGSDRGKALKSIESALQSTADGKIELHIKASINNGNARGWYRIQGDAEGMVLNFAIVERNLETEVRKGENRGRTLKHENVVRAFLTEPIESSREGSVEVAVPEGVVIERALVIAYLQDPKTMAIVAAKFRTLTGF